MRTDRIQKRSREKASALVITLLLVTVLSIVVVAFLQSMRIERLTARSVLNTYRAQLAAEAGIEEAMEKLTRRMAENPNHAIGYRSMGGQITPVLFGSPNYQLAAASVVQEPLVSGNIASFSEKLGASNSALINTKRSQSDTSGWIGSPVDMTIGTQAHQATRALWVEVLQDPAKPEQPDPAKSGFNPVVARYGYWIEDETAKLDLGIAGNVNGVQFPTVASALPFKRDRGISPADLDIGTLPFIGKKPIMPDDTALQIQGDLIRFRTDYPGLLADSRFADQIIPPAQSETPSADIRLYATSFSLSQELSGMGRKRANLNAIVTNSTDPNAIAGDLDDIAFVITGKHAMKARHPDSTADEMSGGIFLGEPDGTGPMPEFGKRFFPPPVPTAAQQDLYIKRIAANIRDYIDADSQPTFVDETGKVPAAARPSIAPGLSQAKPHAIGKEAIPYLQEHAWRGFIESWSQTGSGSTTVVTATLRIDHYFEFFNPTTKDFTTPDGQFLKVYSQPEWNAGSFPRVDGLDFEIDLYSGNVDSSSRIVFPAGQATVITTSLDPSKDPAGLVRSDARFYRVNTNPSAALRVVGAQSDLAFTDSGINVVGFRIIARSGGISHGNPDGITDYRTEFLFGNRLGLIDFFPALSISLNSHRFSFCNNFSNVGSSTRYLYSSSLRGNDGPSRSGEPRSLSEQISWLDYTSSRHGDQSRFFGNIQGHASNGSPSIPTPAPFGTASTSFVSPSNWPDYHVALNDTAKTALSIIADESLDGIGELGHIYDPHRKISAESNSDILHARGGARSFKIGQPDDVAPIGSGASRSWNNQAWRLCDLFSAEDPSIPLSPVSERGKLNINGVLRDGGVAFRAALRSFTFSAAPEGDSVRASKPLADAEIDALVTSVRTYLQDNGPMLDRGELSEIPFFSGAGEANNAGETPGSTTIDRGREEIFRRSVEMITTRSLSFSVYAVAESVKQLSDGRLVPQGSSRIKRMFRLEPLSGGTPLSSNPSPTAKADAYEKTLVHESSF
jgi:hypothetical protein